MMTTVENSQDSNALGRNYSKANYVATIAFIDTFIVLHPRYNPKIKNRVTPQIYKLLIDMAVTAEIDVSDLLRPDHYGAQKKKLPDVRALLEKDEGTTTRRLEKTKDETKRNINASYKAWKTRYDDYLTEEVKALIADKRKGKQLLCATDANFQKPCVLPAIHSQIPPMPGQAYVIRKWGSTEYCRAESYARSGQAQIFILYTPSHTAILKLYDDKDDYQRELGVLTKLPTSSPFLLVPQIVILITKEELEKDFAIRFGELKNYSSEGVYGFEYRLAPGTLKRLLEIGDEDFFCSQIDRANMSIGEVATMLSRNKFKKLDIQFRDNVWRAILRSVAEGIMQMHRNNVVHLDIKPANIVVHYSEQEIIFMPPENFNQFFGNGRILTKAFAALIDYGSAIEVNRKLPDDVSFTAWYSHPAMDNLEVVEPYFDWFSFAIVLLETLVLKKRMDSIFTVFNSDGELEMTTEQAYEKSKSDCKGFAKNVRSRLETSPYKGVVGWACKVFAREGDSKNYGKEIISLLDTEWYMAYATFYD